MGIISRIFSKNKPTVVQYPILDTSDVGELIYRFLTDEELCSAEISFLNPKACKEMTMWFDVPEDASLCTLRAKDPLPAPSELQKLYRNIKSVVNGTAAPDGNEEEEVCLHIFPYPGEEKERVIAILVVYMGEYFDKEKSLYIAERLGIDTTVMKEAI